MSVFNVAHSHGKSEAWDFAKIYVHVPDMMFETWLVDRLKNVCECSIKSALIMHHSNSLFVRQAFALLFITFDNL